MRKLQFVAGGLGLAAFLTVALLFGQPPKPTDTPASTPTPSDTPTTPPVLVSTATPSPSPTPSVTISPIDAGTVSVPSTLGASPGISPSPSATPIAVQAAALGTSDLGWSEKGAPVFRLDQAVITALAQNPTVLQALEEIRRTKGVVIEIRAEALPQIGPSFTWGWTDPNLQTNIGSFGTFSVPTPPPTPTPTPHIDVDRVRPSRSDISYNVKVTGSQLVFNYSTF